MLVQKLDKNCICLEHSRTGVLGPKSMCTQAATTCEQLAMVAGSCIWMPGQRHQAACNSLYLAEACKVTCTLQAFGCISLWEPGFLAPSHGPRSEGAPADGGCPAPQKHAASALWPAAGRACVPAHALRHGRWWPGPAGPPAAARSCAAPAREPPSPARQETQLVYDAVLPISARAAVIQQQRAAHRPCSCFWQLCCASLRPTFTSGDGLAAKCCSRAPAWLQNP